MSVQKATQGCAQYFDVACPKKRRDAILTMRPVAFEFGKQIEAGRAIRRSSD
jgi:hypothetical protein